MEAETLRQPSGAWDQPIGHELVYECGDGGSAVIFALRPTGMTWAMAGEVALMQCQFVAPLDYEEDRVPSYLYEIGISSSTMAIATGNVTAMLSKSLQSS